MRSYFSYPMLIREMGKSSSRDTQNDCQVPVIKTSNCRDTNPHNHVRGFLPPGSAALMLVQRRPTVALIHGVQSEYNKKTRALGS